MVGARAAGREIAPMGKYVVRRLLDAVPTVFLVLTLVFAALRLLPGDPAIAALGEHVGPEQEP